MAYNEGLQKCIIYVQVVSKSGIDLLSDCEDPWSRVVQAQGDSINFGVALGSRTRFLYVSLGTSRLQRFTTGSFPRHDLRPGVGEESDPHGK